MDFLKLFQSLDELLYEVMSWLIFYPVTLWRALAHPWRMMDYADAELGDSVEQQYTDALSPPLFLLLSLGLSHAIELALVGESQMILQRARLDSLIDNDTNLIVFRVLLFSVFPLVMAIRMVRGRHRRLDRDALKAPFYSQCYVAAPFALAIGIGGTLMQCHGHWAVPVGLALILMTFLWYGSVQARWFSLHLGTSMLGGIGNASRAMVESLVITGVVGTLFV